MVVYHWAFNCLLRINYFRSSPVLLLSMIIVRTQMVSQGILELKIWKPVGHKSCGRVHELNQMFNIQTCSSNRLTRCRLLRIMLAKSYSSMIARIMLSKSAYFALRSGDKIHFAVMLYGASEFVKLCSSYFQVAATYYRSANTIHMNDKNEDQARISCNRTKAPKRKGVYEEIQDRKRKTGRRACLRGRVIVNAAYAGCVTSICLFYPSFLCSSHDIWIHFWIHHRVKEKQNNGLLRANKLK